MASSNFPCSLRATPRLRCLGLLRLDREDLPVDLLGRLQPAALMVPEGDRQGFRYRCFHYVLSLADGKPPCNTNLECGAGTVRSMVVAAFCRVLRGIFPFSFLEKKVASSSFTHPKAVVGCPDRWSHRTTPNAL